MRHGRGLAINDKHEAIHKVVRQKLVDIAIITESVELDGELILRQKNARVEDRRRVGAGDGVIEIVNVQGPGHVVVIEWGIVVVVVVVMEQETADIAVNHPEEGIAAMIIDGSLKTRQINKPTEDIQ